MRRARVAVIDDDESVRTALVRLFRSVDFDAFAFASARAFLSEFRDLSLDCVVLDLQMPEMTGLDLQRYLKMVYPNLCLPVVMITAHDEPGSSERCLAAGVAAYMRKPVEGTKLVNEIRKLVPQAH
jgi:FixJ family two-component response regulator